MLDAVKKLMDGPSVPYVVSYRIGERSSLPKDFDLSQYSGLAICHLTVEEGTNRLLAYWSSEQHFRTHGRCMEQALHLHGLEAGGSLSDLRTPDQHWWEHVSFKDWIVSTAGVVSAITLLGGIVVGLFEPPRAQVVFTDMTPLRVNSNATFTASVNIVNDETHDKVPVSKVVGVVTSETVSQPVAVSELEALAAAADGKTVVTLGPDQGSLAPLAVDESKKVTFTGVAPKRQSDDGPPETYKILLCITATAGKLREKRDFSPATPRTIEVWPSQIGVGESAIIDGGAVNGTSADAAEVMTYLYPGLSFSVVAGVIPVTSAPDEISEIVAADKVGDLPPYISGNSATREIRFRLKSLEQFKPYKLVFHLQASKSLTAERWKQIVHDIKVSAEPD